MYEGERTWFHAMRGAFMRKAEAARACARAWRMTSSIAFQKRTCVARRRDEGGDGRSEAEGTDKRGKRRHGGGARDEALPVADLCLILLAALLDAVDLCLNQGGEAGSMSRRRGEGSRERGEGPGEDGRRCKARRDALPVAPSS